MYIHVKLKARVNMKIIIVALITYSVISQDPKIAQFIFFEQLNVRRFFKQLNTKL